MSSPPTPTDSTTSNRSPSLPPQASPSSPSRSRWSSLRRLVFPLLILSLMVGVLAWGLRAWSRPSDVSQNQITAPVVRASLPVLVSAGGELESAKTVDVVCEVEGQQTKIVEMLPEGTYVQTGQQVLWLDPSDLNRQLAEQRIKLMRAEAVAKAAEQELKIEENLAASRLAQAQLELTLAELDQKKFLEGDYQVEVNDLKGAIALAEAELQEARDAVGHFQNLVKKGFRTPEQLRSKEQQLMRAEYTLSREQEKWRVLERFTFERESVELAANKEEAGRELQRVKSSNQAVLAKAQTDYQAARATADWEKEQLSEIQQQLEHCTVKAPQDGVVVYAKDRGKRIELGGAVHFKQKLFSLPETVQLQVRAFVHESVLNKVRSGQRAKIRIDAYPDTVLQGQVLEVETFYDATRHWLSGGHKEYATTVSIEALSGMEPKPGMTAEVEILVSELSDALMVPLQAVAQREGQYYCYVLGPQKVERRPVTLGENTDSHVEIRQGLEEGERVAMNARARAAGQWREGPESQPEGEEADRMAAN